MKFTNVVRQHWAALRALLVFTVILGAGYPLLIWLVAQLPGLHDKAEGSIIRAHGKPVGSRLIGQSFTDAAGRALPQYFQSRPSAAGDGYDPTASGAGNLGPESVVDTPADPAKLAAGAKPAEAGFKPSLLTLVCSRSKDVGELEQVGGSRPFCTGGGVGAVLSVIGPRDARGNVVHPTRVVSVNEPCATTSEPFVATYEGVRVECARFGEDYSIGQIVPIRGSAPSTPEVPADAVTASGSGLDPDISPAYADIQVTRIARARHVTVAQVRELVGENQRGRDLGIFGEPRVNVLQLNLQLDQRFPVAR
ncbi:potassium-transporting ATPase subunit C [Mycobacterium noviomagense]|uniref:Potassium-transporting ATPase KdpC subunit n=1 Tax=Mycobacterium noviomagense TaxID=459858 RepID=A0A7I7P9U5_9MYCO|nr:potassium-transporting ATPase subunit C [Mycobacterium noviomagense]ORB11097.1 K+-transporting ATPase subunit C [Mycobacterium noviomagense]BBY05356.1 potassium-transporting ATPase KdpC subunit [Mycobacterium noviomagense]